MEDVQRVHMLNGHQELNKKLENMLGEGTLLEMNVVVKLEGMTPLSRVIHGPK